jgi:hypothetical protein
MSRINAFWLFIYSTPNIVGSILGLIGLSLYFAGIIKSFWLPIVAGLYLTGYIGWPRSTAMHLKMSGEMEVKQVKSELDKLVTTIAKRVLPETLEKVKAIAALVIELLPRVENNPHHRHVLMQTATDYLPSMLEHYLNLPVAFARFHPMKNGKTPRRILLDQLTLLEQQLHTIAHDIHAGDTSALLAHSRFLQEKFGTDQSLQL